MPDFLQKYEITQEHKVNLEKLRKKQQTKLINLHKKVQHHMTFESTSEVMYLKLYIKIKNTIKLI